MCVDRVSVLNKLKIIVHDHDSSFFVYQSNYEPSSHSYLLLEHAAILGLVKSLVCIHIFTKNQAFGNPGPRSHEKCIMQRWHKGCNPEDPCRKTCYCGAQDLEHLFSNLGWTPLHSNARRQQSSIHTDAISQYVPI